jgi:hypothetical protein
MWAVATRALWTIKPFIFQPLISKNDFNRLKLIGYFYEQYQKEFMQNDNEKNNTTSLDDLPPYDPNYREKDAFSQRGSSRRNEDSKSFQKRSKWGRRDRLPVSAGNVNASNVNAASQTTHAGAQVEDGLTAQDYKILSQEGANANKMFPSDMKSYQNKGAAKPWGEAKRFGATDERKPARARQQPQGLSVSESKTPEVVRYAKSGQGASQYQNSDSIKIPLIKADSPRTVKSRATVSAIVSVIVGAVTATKALLLMKDLTKAATGKPTGSTLRMGTPSFTSPVWCPFATKPLLIVGRSRSHCKAWTKWIKAVFSCPPC